LCLRRAVPGAGTLARRRRGGRQPRRTQGRRRAPGDRRGAGASILYLPPYSPDLNPIEQLFAKLKALLRKAAARTKDQLWSTIGRLLEAYPPAECTNYLNHCGYGST
jgi:transposase